MKVIFLFVSLFTLSFLHAQTTADSLQLSINIDSAKAVSKTHNNTKTIVLAAGYAGFTFLCYRYFDDDVQQFSQANQNKTLSSVSHTIGYAGLGTSSIVITSVTAVTSVFTKDKKLQKTAVLLAGGHVLNDLITNELKITFQRHRPNTGDPYNTFDWRGGSKTNTSFVSSHTSNAFATATAFATVYQDKKWVPLVAYSAATLVGFSRIYDNAHWASDVLAGAAIGFASVKAVNGLYNLAAKKFTFIPQVSNGHYGAMMICYLGK